MANLRILQILLLSCSTATLTWNSGWRGPEWRARGRFDAENGPNGRRNAQYLPLEEAFAWLEPPCVARTQKTVGLELGHSVGDGPNRHSDETGHGSEGWHRPMGGVVVLEGPLEALWGGDGEQGQQQMQRHLTPLQVI